MRELKLRLPDDEIIAIDRLAQSRGINRAECLRQLIRGTAPSAPNLAAYHRLSSEIHRQLGGDISRLHAEQAAAIAVNILAS